MIDEEEYIKNNQIQTKSSSIIAIRPYFYY